MAATADAVVNLALSYVGIAEAPVNDVIFNTHYYGHSVNGSKYPWCMAFVWDVFRIAEASELFYDGKKTASCPTLMAWADDKKKLYTTGQRGDIVFFNFGGGNVATHTGIVVTANADGSCETVEGNTGSVSQTNGGMVATKHRTKGVILGFYRPDYRKETPMATTKKEKAFKPYAAVVNVKSYLTVREGPGIKFPGATIGGQKLQLPPNMVISICEEQSGFGRISDTPYWVSLTYLKK